VNVGLFVCENEKYILRCKCILYLCIAIERGEPLPTRAAAEAERREGFKGNGLKPFFYSFINYLYHGKHSGTCN
jgi:hypothetical protein